ncbi:hypothetical protein SP108700_A0033 [Streptococcus pneumoniae CDC1087-00]|nr:hypothetical protein SP108700_A0033 [Streptococcus pneumoniae CDC1087-00]
MSKSFFLILPSSKSFCFSARIFSSKTSTDHHLGLVQLISLHSILKNRFF